MCFSETWLSCSSNSYGIQGFNVFRSDREIHHLSRGGTIVYVSTELKSEQVLFETRANLIEVCIVKVVFGQNLLAVVCVYRSPKCHMQSTLQCISRAISMAQSLEGVDSVVFVGDFNENLLIDTTHPIRELFLRNHYLQLVQTKTHRSGSLLDAAYVKGQIVFSATVMPTYFSDHEAVILAHR